MKKFLLASIVCAICVLISGTAFSRGGGGGGGGRGNGGNQTSPTPRPTPTPTPTPAPVQGTISNVTAFVVSIKTSPEAAEQTYKVGFQTTITVNNSPATVAALKPGMTATITPDADKNATKIVATMPVPVAVATPAAQAPSRSTAPQPAPPGSTVPQVTTPFGTTAPIQ